MIDEEFYFTMTHPVLFGEDLIDYVEDILDDLGYIDELGVLVIVGVHKLVPALSYLEYFGVECKYVCN